MNSSEASVTERLCSHVVATSLNDVPGPTRARISEHVMDVIGVGLAASGETAGGIITGLFSSDAGDAGARIIGVGKRVEPWDAAWANGSLCHLLDFDDVGFTHPSTCIVPAVLAIGEREGSSGGEMLAALAAAYEAFAQLFLAIEHHDPRLKERGVHPTCVLGVLAAAAGAGKLLGLSREQLMIAMGLAASSGFGLLEHHGTWAKGVQAGNVARAGVVGALMARQDYYASSAAVDGRYGIFNAIVGEGNYDLSNVGAHWGDVWAIDDPGIGIKPFPVCGGGQRVASTAVELRRNELKSHTEIDRVAVSATESLLQTLHIDRPRRGFEGKFCIRYILAVGLVDGRVDIDSFSDESFARSEVQDMMKRVELTVVKGGYDDPLARRRTPVKVFRKDGSVVEKEEFNPRGSIHNRLSHAEVVDKYKACASRVLGESDVNRSIAFLENLESTTVRDLVGSIATRAKATRFPAGAEIRVSA